MADHGADDLYMPETAIDWAPTKVFVEVRGEKEAALQSRSYARDTSTRWMPIDQPEVIVVEQQQEECGGPNTLIPVLVGLSVGILITGAVIYLYWK